MENKKNNINHNFILLKIKLKLLKFIKYTLHISNIIYNPILISYLWENKKRTLAIIQLLSTLGSLYEYKYKYRAFIPFLEYSSVFLIVNSIINYMEDRFTVIDIMVLLTQSSNRLLQYNNKF